MKTAAIFMALLMSITSCAPVRAAAAVDIAIDLSEPATPAPTMSSEQAPGLDNYYVPRISLNGPVDHESTYQVMALMSQTVSAGAKAIVLEMNTPGGSVGAGFNLSKAIEESPVPVICVVDGEAASMGFYLLQSCSLRLMTKRSSLMAHEPSLSGEFGGHPNEWKSIAELLRVMTLAMTEHMVHRMNISAETMMAKITGGQMWWFDWHEALRTKAVDGCPESVGAVVASYRSRLKAPELVTKP